MNSNRRLLSVEGDVDGAIDEAISQIGKKGIKDSAEIFESHISLALQTRNGSQNPQWARKLGKFLTKFYPLAILSLRLMSTVALVQTPDGCC